MRDDLVKRLREAAKMSEVLAVLLPHSEGNATAKLYNEAADAIKELQKAVNFHKFNSEFWEGKYNILADEKWIPVTERLPEDRQSVLVHRDDGGIFIFEYFTTSPTDECWIDDHLNVYSAYSVTHWMPLPEPPKEE